ncbi:NAD(P)-binding protein [Trichoderma longibrachiatum ATCC 18648]|uniref:NAD(P)-binding protein n=1 Tax=Trichoderma longibrachiatum ATCC 18648 TaxID=983965 RepID=A0A2T4C4T5_TRILO|nr:NAD(P)-binding protein [Trichoderma longibrachiatum ATCC 18648]
MWNDTSIPDLNGRVALVTGGKCVAIDSILSENHSITGDRLVWPPLDLSKPSKIVEAVQLLSSREKRLDILINNAGVAADHFTMTVEGFESTIAVNSIAEKFGPKHNNFSTAKDLSDPGTTDRDDYTSRKTVFSRCGASKLANLLFTRELQRRLDEEGVKIIALAVDPGPVATDGGMGVFPGFLKPVLKLVMKSPEKGAFTQLYCATAKEVAEEPEKYRGKLLTAPGKVNMGSDRSRNSELAQSLWIITEEALRIIGI